MTSGNISSNPPSSGCINNNYLVSFRYVKTWKIRLLDLQFIKNLHQLQEMNNFKQDTQNIWRKYQKENFQARLQPALRMKNYLFVEGHLMLKSVLNRILSVPK